LDASGRAAKKREEIASFHCSVPPVLERKEWHTLGTVALRDFDPANDRLGVKTSNALTEQKIAA
jgi:hypothetical protein